MTTKGGYSTLTSKIKLKICTISKYFKKNVGSLNINRKIVVAAAAVYADSTYYLTYSKWGGLFK